ncbi:MAG: hypothetical protein RLZZ200_248 [Pseudomonadota bacterium]|jgi:hypothetical protein
MRIAKPILLVTTPLGLAIGLTEGYHLAGGLVVLMAIMVALFGIGILAIVRAVRSEATHGHKGSGGPAP